MTKNEKKKSKLFWVFFWIICFFSKKLIFMKNNSESLEKEKFNFSQKIIFFHKCCKNTKIVSGYAYFTPKLFEMCLKGYCGLVCAFRWKKKRILKVLVLVKIWSFFKKNTKKGEFSLLFFLTTLFSVGNRQTSKKNHIGHPKWLKCWPKQFWWHWNKNWREKSTIWTPPPIDPYMGGGCFWNQNLVYVFTWHAAIYYRKFKPWFRVML